MTKAEAGAPARLKTPIVRCIVCCIFSLLSFAAISSLPLTSSLAAECNAPHSHAVEHETENGAAALTYPIDLKKDFIFSASLDLPKIPNNRSWYCVWIMVGEMKGTSEHPSMLQAGLIRWDQSNFQMQPFITTEESGRELKFKPVAGDLSGYHRFAISADPSTLTLRMDGTLLMSAPRAEFFAANSQIYLKIAAEVFAVGDAASGLVNNVTLISGARKPAPPIPGAAFEDRGLKFLCKGNGQWAVTGRFGPKLHFVQYVPSACR